MPPRPIIPEEIIIHLGAPGADAANVSETFPDYIKNVASSEVYPTWPREALKANIIAQISVALNRVYTAYYRNSGYDFDITNSPAYDQTYIYQRDIFSNISEIVDEIFNSYIRKADFVEPLFAQFCDGVEVSCDGLSQWGSVALANDGLDYFEILKNYYGNDIVLEQNVPVGSSPPLAPPSVLSEGDSGRDVEILQRRLNRISANFPGIPKIPNADGFFDSATTDAVRKFQEVFTLPIDGLVGRATWNRVQAIYTAVKKLYSINSEGLTISELSTRYPGELSIGDSGDGVLTMQYYLSYIALFVQTVTSAAYDGSFGEGTRSSVISFQKTYGLPETGVVDRTTWDNIESVYQSLIANVDFGFADGATFPFPGRILSEGTEGNDVRILQEYLNYISNTYNEIPKVNVDGIFGASTAAQVRAFKTLFDLPGEPTRVNAATWNALTDIYEDLFAGDYVNEGQFPGYTIS